MVKQPEAKLHVKIRDRLRKEVGGWWVKIWQGPFSKSGTPDILGCVNKLFIALEVKVGRNEVEPIQKETLRRIRKEGDGFAAVVYTADQAVEVVRNYLLSVRRFSETDSQVQSSRKNRRFIFRPRNRQDLGCTVSDRGTPERQFPRIRRRKSK